MAENDSIDIREYGSWGNRAFSRYERGATTL